MFVLLYHYQLHFKTFISNMDIFLMTKQNLSLQLFIARRSEVPGDAVMERRMYTAEKKNCWLMQLIYQTSG